MDLMTLAAKLTLDDSSFRSGIKDAETAGERLAGKMSSMTVAVGNIMSDLIKQGFNAVKDMVGGAVSAYADYEQLIGGVETLFKDNADKVAEYAKQSFKTTGLSANAYMETVTSFSASLLQGLKGNTEEAAELANTAITDMADNANKMGTDMSSIQTAYQGFAKQNYTMLDNLKLGYGGTKEEMVRLINDSGILDKKIKDLDNISFDQIIEAIHEIQTQMGITGTTAKEAASTISGSEASLKAAWEDLLSAVGGEGGKDRLNESIENFQESFSTYMGNVLPTLTRTIANIGVLATGVSAAVAALPQDTVSKLLSAGWEAGTGVIKGAKEIVHWLIESITKGLEDISVDSSDIESFGAALGDFLGSTISDLAKNAPAIVTGVINAGVALAGSFIEGLFKGLFGTGSQVDDIAEKLNKELLTINEQSTEADAILAYMGKLVKQYGEAATETGEWEEAENQLEEKLKGAKDVFAEYGTDVQGAITKLQAMNSELRKAAILSAMEGALNDEIGLLTTQNVELARQQGKAGVAQSKMDTAYENVLNYIKENADSMAEFYKDQSTQMGMYDPFVYKRLHGYSEGVEYDAFGNFIQRIDGMDWEGLEGVLAEILSDADAAKAYVDSQKNTYEEGKNELTKANEEITRLETEISATKEKIEEDRKAMNTAFEKTVEDLGISGEKTGKAIENVGIVVVKSFADIADGIRKIQLPSQIGSNSPSYNNTRLGNFGPSISLETPEPGKATGMDYVPYDGFRAELHKGEAILTRDENESRRAGVDYSGMEEALTDAIERSMSRIYINMSGEKVGNLTTRTVSGNISGNEHARVRAMGG